MKPLRPGADRRVEKINARLKDIRSRRRRARTRSASRSCTARSPSPTTSCRRSCRAAARTACSACSSFEVSGPFNPTGLSATPSRERIFVCHPTRGDDAAAVRRADLSELATRAYRRPLAEDGPHGRCSSTTATGVAASGFEEGIRSAHHGHSREPVLPVSHRDAARRRRAGRGVRASTTSSSRRSSRSSSGARFPTTSCASLRVRGELGDATVLRAAGRAHARGPARRDARAATSSTSGSTWRGSTRSSPDRVDVPVRVGPRRSAQRLSDGARAVREEHLRRGPQRRRSS